MEEEIYLACYDAGLSDDSLNESLDAARAFILPGILHYVKNVFTRYQLLLEVLQHDGMEGSKGAEVNGARSTFTALLMETADSYDSEIAPFIELLNSLYLDGRSLSEKYPSCSEGKADADNSPLARMALSVLRNAASSVNAELVGDPKDFSLPEHCWFRFFGPLAGLIAKILRAAGPVSMYVEPAKWKGAGKAKRASGHQIELQERRAIALVLRRAGTASEVYRRLESAARNQEFAFSRPKASGETPDVSSVCCCVRISAEELRFELFSGSLVLEQ